MLDLDNLSERLPQNGKVENNVPWIKEYQLEYDYRNDLIVNFTNGKSK